MSVVFYNFPKQNFSCLFFWFEVVFLIINKDVNSRVKDL